MKVGNITKAVTFKSFPLLSQKKTKTKQKQNRNYFICDSPF